jgi:hypothetical protein
MGLNVFFESFFLFGGKERGENHWILFFVLSMLLGWPPVSKYNNFMF